MGGSVKVIICLIFRIESVREWFLMPRRPEDFIQATRLLKPLQVTLVSDWPLQVLSKDTKSQLPCPKRCQPKRPTSWKAWAPTSSEPPLRPHSTPPNPTFPSPKISKRKATSFWINTRTPPTQLVIIFTHTSTLFFSSELRVGRNLIIGATLVIVQTLTLSVILKRRL